MARSEQNPALNSASNNVNCLLTEAERKDNPTRKWSFPRGPIIAIRGKKPATPPEKPATNCCGPSNTSLIYNSKADKSKNKQLRKKNVLLGCNYIRM